MLASFVILLDSSVYNYVRNLQLKIYQQFKAKEATRLEPHITIKYAFEIDNLGKLENSFDEIFSLVKEFEVKFTRIGSFENEKNVVFLDVEKNDILSKLHLQILKKLSEKFNIKPGAFEGEGLHFHITLAYKDISTDTFQKIKDYLKDEKPNFDLRVRRIGLYLLPDEETNWLVYKVRNLAE